MRRAEQIACLFWIIVSLSVCTGAIGLKLGTPSDPGPGFLPFGTGALLGILALVHLLKVSVAASQGEADGFLWQGVNWQRSLFVVLAILFYAMLLPHLGYLIATFILLVILFSLYDRKKWGIVVPASLFVIGITYLVFHVWLKVQFPSGFFRIG
jgi:putative tricarboxylic transport membrane protein